MSAPIRVLFWAARKDDSALVERELGSSGCPCEVNAVTDFPDFAGCLDRASWDLLLADHALCEKTLRSLVDLARARQPHVPLVLLGNTSHSLAALPAIRAGVDEFLGRNELHRLALVLARPGTRCHGCVTNDRHEEPADCKYRLIFDQLDDAVFVADPDTGLITDANRQAEVLMGRSRHQLIGLHQRHLHPADLEDSYARDFQRQAISGNYPRDKDVSVIRADGQVVPISLAGTVVTWAGRRLAIGVFRDITQRRQMEQRLRQSEASHRSLFEDCPISLWLEDFSGVKTYLDELRASGVTGFHAFLAGHPDVVRRCMSQVKILDINRCSQELYKAASKQDLLDSLDRVIGEQALDAWRQCVEAVAEGKNLFEVETTNRTLTGDLLHIHLRWSVVPGHEQTYARVMVSITDITAYKKAQEALRDGEQRLQLYLDSAGDAIYVLEAESGRFVNFNSRAVQMLGYSRDELLRLSVKDVECTLLPEARADVHRRASKGIVSVEGMHRRKDGSTFPVEIRLTSLRPSHSHLLLAVVRDTTERKQAEQALRDSEERYRQLVELSPDSIIIHRDGRVVFINPMGLKLLGASHPGQVLGKHVLDFIHPDSKVLVAERMEVTRRQQVPSPLIEQRCCRLDGGTIDVESVAIPLLYDGQPAVQVISRDITSRKRAEDALRQSEDKYRSLFETMTHGVIHVDPQGCVMSANPAAERITGMPVEQMRAEPVHAPRWDLVREDGSPMPGSMRPTALALSTRKRVTGIVMGIINAQTGRRRWLNANGVPIFKPGSDIPAYIYTTFEDITEQREMEEALRQSEERFRRLAENAQDFIYRYRLLPTVGHDYVSPGLTRMMGYTPEELYARPELLLTEVHPDDRLQLEAHFQGALSFTEPLVIRWRHRNGTWVPIECRDTPIYDEAGRLIAIEGIARDISDRRRAEEAMLERTRLRDLSHRILSSQEEERRRLSRELHDEAGQALTAIKINAELLTNRIPDNMTALKRLARDTTELAVGLISEMRRIATALRPAVLEDLGLLPTLRWYVKSVEMRYGLRVKLINRGLKGRLEQSFETAIYRIVQEALTNVVRHAQAKHATVRVTCCRKGLDLSISDDGKGVNLASIRRGTGLTGIRERAHLFQGTMAMESEPGDGTTVRVTFPCILEAAS